MFLSTGRVWIFDAIDCYWYILIGSLFIRQTEQFFFKWAQLLLRQISRTAGWAPKGVLSRLNSSAKVLLCIKSVIKKENKKFLLDSEWWHLLTLV